MGTSKRPNFGGGLHQMYRIETCSFMFPVLLWLCVADSVSVRYGKGHQRRFEHRSTTRGGVNKQDFDDYFEGQVNAKALEITQIWECETPVSLSELRGEFSNFVVPQSWRYVRDNEVPFLQQLKSQHKKQTHRHQEDTRQSFSSSMQLQCAQ